MKCATKGRTTVLQWSALCNLLWSKCLCPPKMHVEIPTPHPPPGLGQLHGLVVNAARFHVANCTI